MIHAGGADGTHHTGKTQGIQFGLGQVQVLQAPSNLLSRHDFALAKAFLRGADTFNAQHGTHGTPQVQHLANLFLGACALAFGVDQGQHVGDNFGLEVRAMLQGNGVVPFGTIGHIFHIRFCTGPPHTIHLLARVTCSLCFFNSSAVHHTPAPQERVIRFGLTDLQPGRLLLHTRRRHGQQLQVEAQLRRTLLQQRDGFLAKWAVVVDQCQLLALELVKAAFFFADGLQDGVCRHPVGTGNREVPLEDAAVSTLTAAIPHGHHRYLVGRCFFRDGEGCTGRQWLHQCGTAVFTLEALVTLYAARRVITRFALLKAELDTIDTTPHIDQLEVVHIAVGPWHTIGGIGAGAVRQHRYELLFGLCKGSRRQQR